MVIDDYGLEIIRKSAIDTTGGLSKYSIQQSDAFGGYTQLTETVSSVLTYYGIAPYGSATSDAVWRVGRKTVAGGIEKTEWANNGTFDQVWDNRGSIFTAVSFFNANSLFFDGVSDYLNGGDIFQFDIANQMALSLWIKPDNVSAQRCLFSKSTNDANAYGWGLYHTDTGAILLQVRTASTLRNHTSTATLTAGAWNHLLLTYDGSSNMDGVRLYFDSVVDTVPTSASLSGTVLYNQDVYFGRRDSSFYYSGYMDEISGWNKSLTQAEVNSVYNSGSPNDLSGLSFSGDLLNWYRMGDGDSYPLVLDNAGSDNLTMQNMSSSNFVGDTP